MAKSCTRTEALLERAVQLDPSFARAKAFLARTLIDQFADAPEGRTEDKLTRAATLLSDAEAIIPSSKRVLIGRASLLWWQERYPEALAAAQRLMEVYPNDADANTMLAILTLATGGADEAIPLFEKAIRLDPRGSFLAWRYRRIGYALLVGCVRDRASRLVLAGHHGYDPCDVWGERDAVPGMWINSRQGTTGAHRAGLPPVSLPVWEAVQ